jgi:hypothetical protein
MPRYIFSLENPKYPDNKIFDVDLLRKIIDRIALRHGAIVTECSGRFQGICEEALCVGIEEGSNTLLSCIANAADLSGQGVLLVLDGHPQRPTAQYLDVSTFQAGSLLGYTRIDLSTKGSRRLPEGDFVRFECSGDRYALLTLCSLR